MTTNLIPIQKLEGRVVTWWQGGEMALAEARAGREVRWEDPSVPFLQFVNLDLRFDDGQAVRLLSQLEDGTGFHGFYVEALDELPKLRVFDESSSILRDRVLSELPLGKIEFVELRHDGPSAIVEMRLRLSGAEIRLLAAEIYEEHDASLRIGERDESILIQVNGARPSQSGFAF